MTIKSLASLIAKIEGKKSQARVGDVREILGILSDLVYQDEIDYFWELFYENGKKRSKRKKKVQKVSS